MRGARRLTLCCGCARGVTTAAAAEQPCAEAADPPAAGLGEAVALPPGLDAASTKRRVREVVVFPLNGRPWDSDFHPYHDAMRLWWLLEFAQLLQNGRG